MLMSASIRAVFGHFQNLNLLALLHDLRSDQTARQAWSTGTRLCPIAHGLRAGQQVRELTILGQAADDGCDYAARHLGADPVAVLRFVRSWDEETLSRLGLLQQLQELWEERLADAEAVQALLHGVAAVPEAGAVERGEERASPSRGTPRGSAGFHHPIRSEGAACAS
ncbi:MAG: hypothetical protein L0Z62_31205 [Gemmataceae bacterium]|nr:hypothetical protein [Gemmataceae bacterium]